MDVDALVSNASPVKSCQLHDTQVFVIRREYSVVTSCKSLFRVV